MTNETDNATALTPDTLPPVDAGDAGGVGNSEERIIAPATLVETAAEAEARGQRWRPV